MLSRNELVTHTSTHRHTRTHTNTHTHKHTHTHTHTDYSDWPMKHDWYATTQYPEGLWEIRFAKNNPASPHRRAP